MSDDDPQVIVLHRDEIAFVRKATHSQLTHDPEHGTQKTTFIDLEIGLNNPDTSALEKALAEEAARPGWGGRSQTKFLDFPVQVLDKGIVKITWRGTGCSMRPGIESALGTLASLTTVQNETRADDDLTVSALRELPEDQQKTKLKQLALRDRTSAIETARRLYKTSLGEAKTMVEGLIADRQTPAT
jgi:hypothetical protein